MVSYFSPTPGSSAEPARVAWLTAGGELHTILTRPEFYTYAAGGHRLRDWVAALAAGEAVPDVACTDCAEADTVAAGP